MRADGIDDHTAVQVVSAQERHQDPNAVIEPFEDEETDK
jgi:hypothetical protein